MKSELLNFKVLFFLTLFFVLSGLAKSSLASNTFYVSLAGSDTAGDGSINNPWRSIANAVNNSASPGDTVKIMPGDYTGDGIITITNPNPGPSIITITANDPKNKPIIKSFYLNPGKGKGYMTFSYLEINGEATAYNNGNNGFTIETAKYVTIDHCYIHHANMSFIYTQPSCVTGLDKTDNIRGAACYHNWDMIGNLTITNNIMRWFYHTAFLLFGKDILVEGNDIALADCPGSGEADAQCDFLWPFGLNQTWRNNYIHHIAARYDGYSGSDFIQTFEDDGHSIRNFLFKRNRVVGVKKRFIQADVWAYRSGNLVFRNNLWLGIGAAYGNVGMAGHEQGFGIYNNTFIRTEDWGIISFRPSRLNFSLDSGKHNGANNFITLTDTTKNWVPGQWIGFTLWHWYDGDSHSSCIITDNTENTLTCTLSGGATNRWHPDDSYSIYTPMPPLWRMEVANNISLNSHGGFGMVWYDSDNAWSRTNCGFGGRHTGSDNASVLEDGTVYWTDGQWIGYTLKNTVDGSQCTVTGNTANTINCMLNNGLENNWDTNDTYLLSGPCYAGANSSMEYNSYYPFNNYGGNEALSKCSHNGVIDPTCGHNKNGIDPKFVNDTFIYTGVSHDFGTPSQQTTTRILLGSSSYRSNGWNGDIAANEYAEVDGDGVLRRIINVGTTTCGSYVCNYIDIASDQALSAPLGNGHSVLVWSTSNGNLAYDYRLRSDSQLRDAGLTLSGFANDYLGNFRPQGSAWDIGAYEYVSGGDITPPAAPSGLNVQ